jgi:hypothetical protein
MLMLMGWDFAIGMTFPSDHPRQRLTGKLQGFMKYGTLQQFYRYILCKLSSRMLLGDRWSVLLVSEFNLVPDASAGELTEEYYTRHSILQQ